MPDLILDAYGDPTLYERLLGVPVKDVSVESDLGGSNWYYVPVRTSRESLADFDSPAWKEMDRVMGELKKSGDVLVGSYLAYAKEIGSQGTGATFSILDAGVELTPIRGASR